MNIDNLIMTTRIRLARNLADIPFVIDDRDFFRNIATSLTTHIPALKAYELDTLPERDSLFEQHLISADFLKNATTGILLLSNDNKISIMLGEEDHIRIQAMTHKYNLLDTYRVAKDIADKLEIDFTIAKDPNLGYLTRCPTNLGGGLRASVMMYLPALTITKQLSQVLTQAGNDKITIRGVYGENSDASGCIYQISNQNCITMTDETVLTMLNDFVQRIATIELNLQKKLWQEKPDKIIDKVLRAWGILTNAHLLTSEEAVEQLAWLKLGVSLKIISFKNDHIIDDLFFITRPATLAATHKLAHLDQLARDRLRAAQIREKLLLFRIK